MKQFENFIEPKILDDGERPLYLKFLCQEIVGRLPICAAHWRLPKDTLEQKIY